MSRKPRRAAQAAQSAPPTAPPPDGPAHRGRRRLFLVLVVAVLAVTILAGLSLRRIGTGERAYLVGQGRAVRLGPGLHVFLPFGQRLARLPADPLAVNGQTTVRSREGSSLSAPWSVEASAADAAVERMLAEGDDPAAFLRESAAAAIGDWTREASVEALLLGEGRSQAEERLRRRLEQRGFEAITARLGPIEGPAGMRQAIARRVLEERSRVTGIKVALIGLDGADWELIDPLIARGRLPNLARLKTTGAWGLMKSMDPMLSPLLWTTVATGQPPETHGVIDFLARDARTGKPVPVSSRVRRVKALWNMLTDAGRSTGLVGWWATWPAEAIEGRIVSDRVAYSTFTFTPGLDDPAGATWPKEYFGEIRNRLVAAESIPDSDLRRFADATPEEFRRLATIVAGARSYHAAGLDILARGQPDLFIIYYQGIDEVSHRFAHFMPPKMAMVTEEDFRRYQGTVTAYYEYQDALLGEILRRLEPGTVTIVMSDHGFRNGTGRPEGEPPYIEGKPGLWHRRYGIFIMNGRQAKPGRLDTTSLLDVAPTVLYLLGLPLAEDQPGRIVEEAIDAGFRSQVTARTIPSYESLGAPAAAADLVADSRVEEEMLAKLKSLGYVSGGNDSPAGPAGGTTAGPGGGAAGGPAVAPAEGMSGDQTFVTAHLNEAAIYLKNGDYRRADAAVAQVLKSAPDLVPGLLLKAQIAREQKHWEESIATYKRVIAADPEGERQAYTQIAAAFVDGGRVGEGLAYMRAETASHPRIADAHAALGSLLLASGDRVAAERELLKALEVDPALGEPLANLHTLYKDTDKVLSLEPVVRKGLAINEQSVVHHNWMGLIEEWKGNRAGAEREYHRAMELDPDYAATMANLGALYGRSGRLEEAVAILKRAVAKDAGNLEAWVNLGAAQGRLNRPKEAISALETARSKGARSTTLYNALALAYWQDRQKTRAMEYLKESLALDPGQKDARELLEELNRSS